MKKEDIHSTSSKCRRVYATKLVWGRTRVCEYVLLECECGCGYVKGNREEERKRLETGTGPGCGGGRDFPRRRGWLGWFGRVGGQPSERHHSPTLQFRYKGNSVRYSTQVGTGRPHTHTHTHISTRYTQTRIMAQGLEQQRPKKKMGSPATAWVWGSSFPFSRLCKVTTAYRTDYGFGYHVRYVPLLRAALLHLCIREAKAKVAVNSEWW